MADFKDFFRRRGKTIKFCDELVTDIRLAQSVRTQKLKQIL